MNSEAGSKNSLSLSLSLCNASVSVWSGSERAVFAARLGDGKKRLMVPQAGAKG